MIAPVLTKKIHYNPSSPPAPQSQIQGQISFQFQASDNRFKKKGIKRIDKVVNLTPLIRILDKEFNFIDNMEGKGVCPQRDTTAI